MQWCRASLLGESFLSAAEKGSFCGVVISVENGFEGRKSTSVRRNDKALLINPTDILISNCNMKLDNELSLNLAIYYTYKKCYFSLTSGLSKIKNLPKLYYFDEKLNILTFYVY